MRKVTNAAERPRARRGARQAVPGIGERLKRLRVQRGWSQVETAVEAGMSPNRVADAEVGDLASDTTLRKLAAVFGCTPDELMGKKGAPR